MMNTCSVSWCEREVTAKSLCDAHYRRSLVGADLEPPFVRIVQGGIEERLLARRVIVGTCWEWAGAGDRYGFLRVKGRNMYVHRLAYITWVGPIPAEMVVRHAVCDNPRCFNPAHLMLGYGADNSQDMVDHGRQARGAKNGFTTLTEDDVRSIRADTRKQSIIGADYGITQGSVSKIRRRDTWSHVA